MKTQNAKLSRALLLAVAIAVLPAAVRAEEYVTNRLSASARLGFNMSARFRGTTVGLPLSGTPRVAPHGENYNYDDGYVLTDTSGNYGGQTWYWGYDNSSAQVSGNNILLSKSTPDANFTSPWKDSDPTLGAEITYQRLLGVHGKMSYGVELAGSFQNLDVQDRSTFFGTATKNTYAFAYEPGLTPPTATPSEPYKGSYEGPGMLISDAAVPFSTSVVPGGYSISGARRFNADIFGLRVGPYLDIPVGTNFNVLLSGGLAVAFLNAEATWNDTITFGTSSAPDLGSGSDDAALLGYYLALNLSWDINKDWSAIVGAQYQGLGTYRHNFGGRTVEADFENSLYVTFGVSYRF